MLRVTIMIGILAAAMLIAACGNEPTKKEVSELGPWEIHETKNIHTFIGLNSATGEIVQIQWDVDSEDRTAYRFVIPIYNIKGNGEIGRYKYKKTENIANFIVYDSFLGLVWQCQWSVDEKYARMCWYILKS